VGSLPWYIPPLIFLARICDVSIGTIRIIAVMRGYRALAVALGFFESLIWIFAVSTVISYIKESWVTVIAYAGGYATGTLLGIVIEGLLALGSQMIRVVNTDRNYSVTAWLRESGYNVTQVAALSSMGSAELCFLVVPRRRTKAVIGEIVEYCPQAFITVEDIRSATNGSFIYRDPPSEIPAWKRIIKFR